MKDERDRALQAGATVRGLPADAWLGLKVVGKPRRVCQRSCPDQRSMAYLGALLSLSC